MPRDPKKNVANVNSFRVRRRRALVELSGGCCSRCGYDKCVNALVFHHRDPSTKLFNLSRADMTKTREVLDAEAAKCDLVCANCHAELHYMG
jgi:hypothetical protein